MQLHNICIKCLIINTYFGDFKTHRAYFVVIQVHVFGLFWATFSTTGIVEHYTCINLAMQLHYKCYAIA